MKPSPAARRRVKLPDLPTIGIFAFALASTWSLYQFFNNHAIHPTWLYWIPAALVEIVTAWLTMHIIRAVYKLTRSNALKQDLRFYKIVAIVSTVLVAPTFIASVAANRYEFQGQFWLALLFPVAVVGCAIGEQIPRSVERHQSAGDDKSKQELRKTKRELATERAERKRIEPLLVRKIEQLRTSEEVVDMLRNSLRNTEQEHAELAQSRQLKRADKTVYAELCAGLNGTAPGDAQGANDLLNDNGYYSKSDGTVRNWAREITGEG